MFLVHLLAMMAAAGSKLHAGMCRGRHNY